MKVKMKALKVALAVVVTILVFGSMTPASAVVVNFDDIALSGSRTRFTVLGINTTYAGLQWPNNTSSFGDGVAYWAGVNNSDSSFSGVGAYSGTQAAWNYNDGTTMNIIFPTPVTVQGAYFNVFSAGAAWGAETVQFFGYDALDALVGSSAVLALDKVSNSPAWQFLSAGLTGITRLEIAATQDLNVYPNGEAWWAMDDLTYSRSSDNNVVPEPSTYLLLGSGIAGLAMWRRKRKLNS